MNKSIAQNIAYRQSLMKYAAKYDVSRASRKYTKAVHISTSSRAARTVVWSPWPAGPSIPTAIPISTQKRN